MATLVIGTNFVAGTVAKASEVNGNFSNIVAWSTTLDVDNFATLTGELDFLVSTTKAVKIINNGTANSIDVLSNGNSTAVKITNTGTQPSIDVLSNGNSTGLVITDIGTNSAITVTKSGQLAAGTAIILITDAVSQVNATAAVLKMALSASATIPAIDILHGANTTFQVKSTHLVVPSKTTTERDAIVAAPVASVLFNSTVQELQFKTSSGWAQSVPTGSVQTFAGFIVPTGWLLCDGTAVSRTTYAALFAVLSKSSTGNIHTSTTIDAIPAGVTTNIAVGWTISGPNIPAGTTVTVVLATSLTLSQATSANNNNVAFTAAPHGIGDGTTTFNVPDCRGIFIRGAGTQTVQGKVFSSTLAAKLKDTTAVNGLINVSAGSHAHSQDGRDFGGSAVVSPNGFPAWSDGHGFIVAINGHMSEAGTHTHVISGDTETAPGSITLNYLIKT